MQTFSQMKVFMPLHVWSNEDMPFTWLNGMILEEVWCFYVLNDWLFWGYTCGWCCVAIFVPLETRGKLGWVNFRKDFWDCYYGQGKNWLKPRANGRNIVGQQLPTLLRQQCWEFLRPFARSLMLTGASLVKIPETIMGFPDRFSFLKWRIAHF